MTLGLALVLVLQDSSLDGSVVSRLNFVLRKLRKTPSLNCIKQLDQKEVNVIEYDPEEPVDPEPPLTGMAHFNPVKLIKRKHHLQKQKKRGKESWVESSSTLRRSLSSWLSILATLELLLLCSVCWSSIFTL